MKRKIFLLSALLAGFSILTTSLLITLGAYYNFTKGIQKEVAAAATYIQMGVELSREDYLNQLEPQNGHRLTIVSPDGTVIFDSISNPEQMDNHLDRPEIRDALLSGTGESTRFSDTRREQTYYYAVRLADASVLRIASEMDSIFTSYGRIFWLVVLIAAVVFLLSAFVAAKVTRRIVKPINAIDLDHPVDNEVDEEILPLLIRIKEQQEHIRARVEELNRSRAEFDAITGNMNEGFLVLDRDGKVLSLNKSALHLLQIQHENPVGMSLLALNRTEDFRDILESAIQGTAREHILAIDGRQCQVLANPVMEGQSPRGVVLILMDVTEKQEREKLRREFTANASHELKTPLTAISGYAELMMNGMVENEDIPEFSKHIYQEAQHMITLVKDLMYLSKLEEHGPPSKGPVNLFALSQEVISRLKKKAEEHDITLSLSGDSAEVFGIPSVLKEMVYNLLDNAIQYNKKGGSAAITIQREGYDVLLTVSDTGIGIPTAEHDRIFERFYRVDKSHNRSVEGTGLGLAIVKHGALLHDAVINLTSSDNGSNFTLLFKAL